MPSIKEPYVLIAACLMLIVPALRVLQADYSTLDKKVYQVPKEQFETALKKLKDDRLKKDTESTIADSIYLARLHVKDNNFDLASTLLKDLLQKDVVTVKQRIEVLSALGDTYRDQRGLTSMRLARKQYLAAINSAAKLQNRSLNCRLKIKLANWCYLMGSDDSASAAERIVALKEGERTLEDANEIATEISSTKLQTAIQNFSVLIDLEKNVLKSVWQ
jgi:hypothetical protein